MEHIEHNAMRLYALKLILVCTTMMCVLYNSDVYISDTPYMIYTVCINAYI